MSVDADFLEFVGQVADAEDALFVGFAQEGEHLVAEIEHLLGGIRMEGGLLAPDAQASLVFMEDLCVHTAGVCDQFVEFAFIPFAAVNGARATGLFDPFGPVAGADETVEIDGGHSFECHGDGLRAEEALDLHVEPALAGATERIEIGNIEFVRTVGSVAVAFGGNLAAHFSDVLDQTDQFFRRH